jgi:hypothetical protein
MDLKMFVKKKIVRLIPKSIAHAGDTFIRFSF